MATGEAAATKSKRELEMHVVVETGPVPAPDKSLSLEESNWERIRSTGARLRRIKAGTERKDSIASDIRILERIDINRETVGVLRELRPR